jgi:hypothetical protein
MCVECYILPSRFLSLLSRLQRLCYLDVFVVVNGSISFEGITLNTEEE